MKIIVNQKVSLKIVLAHIEDLEYSIMKETVSSPFIIKGETSFTEAAPINKRKKKFKAGISANCKNVDSWVLLGEDYNDSPTHSFRFCPNNNPGANANLDENSTILDCFKKLFRDKIQDELVGFFKFFCLLQNADK